MVMSGGRKQAQPAGGRPLDGSLELRTQPHTDREPSTVEARVTYAGSVAD